MKCGSSSVGRTAGFHPASRGFESHLPLQQNLDFCDACAICM